MRQITALGFTAPCQSYSQYASAALDGRGRPGISRKLPTPSGATLSLKMKITRRLIRQEQNETE